MKKNKNGRSEGNVPIDIVHCLQKTTNKVCGMRFTDHQKVDIQANILLLPSQT